jgi:hypothetical protein
MGRCYEYIKGAHHRDDIAPLTNKEIDFFCLLHHFLSTGNIVGVTIFTGEVYGVTIFATVTKRYLNCKKQYPEISNYLPHFAGA